jgi:hypothetical protein
MSSGDKHGYGAVDKSEEETGAIDGFKETDLLYYKGSSLSQKEKTAKIIKIAVPVVIAVLLIGGFAWFLLGDFGHLYPGPSGPKPPDHSTITVHPASTPTGTKPVFAPAGKESPSSHTSSTTMSGTKQNSSGGSSSSCTAHSKCSSLGLTGECCPTNAGDILDCC